MFATSMSTVPRGIRQEHPEQGAPDCASMRRRLIVGAALLVLPVVWFCSVSALLTVAALWAQQSGDADAEARSRGRDALWLGHAWVDGRRGPADVERLVARLRDTGIRDLWVHAGPLADDGSLDPARRPYARRLLADIARRAPDVRVSAWLGDVVGPDRLDLTQAPTRERVVASADSVLAEGWAGVHFDLEPLVDGDDDFLNDDPHESFPVAWRRGRCLPHGGQIVGQLAHRLLFCRRERG